MKAKLSIVAVALLILILIFSSCTIRTCPTYATKGTREGKS